MSIRYNTPMTVPPEKEYKGYVLLNESPTILSQNGDGIIDYVPAVLPQRSKWWKMCREIADDGSYFLEQKHAEEWARFLSDASGEQYVVCSVRLRHDHETVLTVRCKDDIF